MKKRFLQSIFLSVLLSMACNVCNAYVDRDIAVVRIMNKAAGKAQTIKVPVGRTVDFEKLSITARTCKQTDPFQVENHFTFVEIMKSGTGQIFGGWLNKNEPGANPLQDADYDLWLVECTANTKE